MASVARTSKLSPALWNKATTAVGVFAVVALLSGCQEALRELNRDLASANSRSAGGMAVNTSEGKSQQTQVTIPNDKRTADAMEAALPTIKKVLSIHQCVKTYEATRQLNYYAVSGVDVSRNVYLSSDEHFPNSRLFMKYHDRNKCLSVRAMDAWTMPALNTLQFRSVYFADDSGETVNFAYQFKKMDNGSWLLSSFQPTR